MTLPTAAANDSPLRITQVTVARVHNLGNYENERLEATALVEPDADPAHVVAALRTFIAIELGLQPRPSPPHLAPPPGADDADDIPF